MISNCHLILVILTVYIIRFSEQQLPPVCAFSRLDVVPCQYLSGNIERASDDNEYSFHFTRLLRTLVNGQEALDCRVRPPNQVINPITIAGSVNTKVLFTPGFLLDENYTPGILGQFNIDCGEGKSAYYNVTDLNVQGRDCVHLGIQRCQDYIITDTDNGGQAETCGHINDGLNRERSGLIADTRFSVFFRSSESLNLEGFRMYVVCFENNVIETGCVSPTDYLSGNCFRSRRDVENSDRFFNTVDRFERQAMADVRVPGRCDALSPLTRYSQLFPSYPPSIRMRRDVADFHNLWRRVRRGSSDNIRFVNRLVLRNESLSYQYNIIRITDPVLSVTGYFSDIDTLRTFDGDGVVTLFTDSATSPFNTPGPLIIVGKHAFFQTFMYDPRGILSTPFEEELVWEMIQILYASIPLSEDFLLNTTFPDEFKRSVHDKYPDYDESEFLRTERQASEAPGQRGRPVQPPPVEFTQENLFLALRYIDACDPVLRAQAVSLFELFNETNPGNVEVLMNFTISCMLRMSQLTCTGDEGFASPVGNLTYCTPNEEAFSRSQCNPFDDVVSYGFSVMNVLVEAINCDGQRATMTVFETREGEP